ncbi:MAG: murein biosynthesis integral membrane protein MurJ [Verrucomicrobiales bacterium]
MKPAQGSPDSSKSEHGSSIARSAGLVSLMVACSRVLGLIREQVFAGLFGASAATDAFQAAFRAPNLLRDLFAEGALSTAFVTTFSQKIEREGTDSAWRLASKVATLTVVFMSGITLLGILFAPQMIGFLAPGFDPEKKDLTILLTRIMFPFILLVSLAALAMGMLNARKVFGVPAMASSFFNLGSIMGGVSIGYLLDPEFGEQALIGLAIGTLIGGLLQLGVQLPSLRKVGFRFAPDFQWRDPGVIRVLQLMGPAVIAASAVQVNVMVNTIFASYLEDGAITWLNYAFRLMQLPLGLFGVALGIVTLPLLSRVAAHGVTEEFNRTLAKSLRFACFLSIPSALGLIFLAEPIISLLFERGRFTPEDTLATAGALRFYALGLVAYSAIKILAPAFYTINMQNAPMYVSLASIGVNAVINWILIFQLGWGHQALALSTGCVAAINVGVLYYLMRRRIGKLVGEVLFKGLGRLLLATIPLMLVCLGFQGWLADLGSVSEFERIFRVGVVVSCGALAFMVGAWLAKVEELQDFIGVVSRRLRR